MPIVKDGAWIAIDSVEHDDSFEGTGRPGDQLKLKSAWQSTLNAWTTAGNPPKDGQTYGMKDGAWTVIGTAHADISEGTGIKIEYDSATSTQKISSIVEMSLDGDTLTIDNSKLKEN